MPVGCTEQQLSSWIPNVVAVKYLKTIGNLTPGYQDKSERYLATGYQQLLNKRHADGSFSLWGATGEKNVWLTAYVAKTLRHAKELISIDSTLIADALNFVRETQNKSDGSFAEQGQSVYQSTLTGPRQNVILTAYLAIAFLENTEYVASYSSTIDSAISYIYQESTNLMDNFAVAVSCYALALKKHPETNNYLNQLKDKAVIQDDEMFWNREQNQPNQAENPSIKVETAAYAIMAFVTADRASEAIPIMKWLMTQRSSTGGFHTTTDTVIAIQALGMIASIFHTPNVNMNIKLTYENDQGTDFSINAQNLIDFQQKTMEKDSRSFSISADGNGFSFFQISYNYNTLIEDSSSRFDLKVDVKPNSNPNLLHLKICAKYIPDGDDVQSQITLLEVFLPSGYEYDPETADLVKLAGVRVS